MLGKTSLGCCFVLLLVSAGTAGAERWIVPAAAHVTGASDTNWRTDLRLVNPTDLEVTVTVYLLEAGRDNSALDRSEAYTVPAQGQVLIADVLVTGFEFEGTGALLVDCADAQLVATTRTYNLVSDGSIYGQFIPAVGVANALAAGEEGQIVHLVKSTDFRSNLGFAATSLTGGRVTVEVYGSAGALLGSTERDFSGYEHYQFNDIFGATGAPPSTVARAVIRTTSPIVAYASVVDQRTGDPVAIMSQRLSEAASELVITAAARASGAQGSVWRTDVRIFNPATTAARLIFSYHQRGVGNGPRPSATLDVGAGEILAVDDFMLNALGLSTANGGLMISADRPVLVWSRTFNRADAGTFGQSIPAVGIPTITKALANHVFTGLGNVGFRSNVGFFNISDADQELDLVLRDGGGNPIGEGSYDLAAGVMDQINDVFSFLGAGGAVGESYWLTVEGEEGVIPYLSVSDNRSNDPVYEGGVASAGACSIGLVSTADTYIRGGDHAETNFGETPYLLIKGIFGGTFARKIYLVFDLDSAPEDFTTVMLDITLLRHVTPDILRDAVLYGIIDNDDWDPGALAEADITWNNAPRNDLVSGVAFIGQGTTSAHGVRQLAIETMDPAHTEGFHYLFDITDFVQWALGDNPDFSSAAPGGDDDGLITLLFAHTEEIGGIDGSSFYSRENPDGGGCYQPQLIFE